MIRAARLAAQAALAGVMCPGADGAAARPIPGPDRFADIYLMTGRGDGDPPALIDDRVRLADGPCGVLVLTSCANGAGSLALRRIGHEDFHGLRGTPGDRPLSCGFSTTSAIARC